MASVLSEHDLPPVYLLQTPPPVPTSPQLSSLSHPLVLQCPVPAHFVLGRHTLGTIPNGITDSNIGSISTNSAINPGPLTSQPLALPLALLWPHYSSTPPQSSPPTPELGTGLPPHSTPLSELPS
ncbi:hypothetical protein NP233_g4535 [Leucocoprinus birnbaumii]|uniref:Uncharacterized protein n=1 Tax=Leucocoprinus birnbaumii TaxID=56174 RepID=A0AAD5YVE7_9AGAR|nr:hypothetical protein NP233_g4535 [Leucocoprinus birnbaumii]